MPEAAADPELRIRSGPGAELLLRLLSFGTAEGMTLGETVLLSTRAAEALDRGEDWARRLLLHEAEHAKQWRRDRPLRFLATYAADYLRSRRAGLPHDAAYRSVRYEAEAFAAERDAGASATTT